MKKSAILILAVIVLFTGCKTAFIKDVYNENSNQLSSNSSCNYTIELDAFSFYNDDDTQNGGIVIGAGAGDDIVIGSGARTSVNRQSVRTDYGAFKYLLQKSLNSNRNARECGSILVSQLENQERMDWNPLVSGLTLGIANILGYPFAKKRTLVTIQYRVFDEEEKLIYDGIHEGEGVGKQGLYSGYWDPKLRSTQEALAASVESFVRDFSKE